MAHTRPQQARTKARRAKNNLHSVQSSKRCGPTPTELLAEATSFLHTGDPNAALPLALRALVLSQSYINGNANATSQTPSSTPITPTSASLAALTLLAEINLELGDANAARGYFLQAVELDPNGKISEDEGGGAEKYLWLAQLCEEGGEESVRWFKFGTEVLRRDIARAEENQDAAMVEEKKRKLVGALCGIVEVYMTDLSLDPDAESQCQTHITAALTLLPSSPAAHQTHASVLISQSQPEAARRSLRTSLELWRALPSPSHPDVPDFPARISLVRLLLEVGLEEDALQVAGGIVDGDEGCVEGWYLGGWGLWVLGGKKKGRGDGEGSDCGENGGDAHHAPGKQKEINAGGGDLAEGNAEEEWIECWRGSLQWLRTCLALYDRLEYEDERLQEHALELVKGIENEFSQRGIESDGDEEGDGEGWESEEGDEDGNGDEDEDEVMG